MTHSAALEASLRQAFNPTSLQIINESHLHAGHGQHDGSGETHLRIKIVSQAFVPMSRVARHRAINLIAAAAVAAGLHALAIEARTPAEVETIPCKDDAL